MAAESVHRPFPFLALPAEIRLMIYPHLLPRDRSIRVRQWLNMIVRTRSAAQSKYGLSILRACKQIGDEAASVLYGSKDFTIPNSLYGYIWLKQIGYNICFIRRLTILTYPMPFERLVELEWDRYNYTELLPQTDPKLSLRISTLSCMDRLKTQWCVLAEMLVNEAVGLKFLRVKFGPNCPKFSDEGMELGKDVDFVRILGSFKNLKELEIYGCFARHWPAYLRGKLGQEVFRAIPPGSPPFDQLSGHWPTMEQYQQEPEGRFP